MVMSIAQDRKFTDRHPLTFPILITKQRCVYNNCPIKTEVNRDCVE